MFVHLQMEQLGKKKKKKGEKERQHGSEHETLVACEHPRVEDSTSPAANGRCCTLIVCAPLIFRTGLLGTTDPQLWDFWARRFC